MKVILVIGSAPEALAARDFAIGPGVRIVAINNAWRVRPDWAYLVHPEDFPRERCPRPAAGQRIITHADYVPANNRYGGIVYAGGTMVFSAAYWVLDALRPDVMAFLGCDMIYDGRDGPSHFYGSGKADPLRRDPTLQSLEAKANRLAILASRQDCLCANLSSLPRSRLTFPRLLPWQLAANPEACHRSGLSELRSRIAGPAAAAASAEEARRKIVVPSGDYWAHPDALDAGALHAIDGLWLAALAADAAAAGHDSRDEAIRPARKAAGSRR